MIYSYIAIVHGAHIITFLLMYLIHSDMILISI